MGTIKTFGDVDARSLEQLERCMAAGDADVRRPVRRPPPGLQPADRRRHRLRGLRLAVRRRLRHRLRQQGGADRPRAADLDALGGVEAVMGEITRRISFGMGVPAAERTDHAVLDRIRNAEFAPQRKLAQLAESQLGTVGSGNHYVNVMADEDDRVWVGVHFGSRGFGHKTASGFLALAQGLPFDGKAHEGEMDSPPVLFEVDSELGQAYIAAMELAGEYAYAGRDIVVAKVLEILGAEAVHEVHNHHNFAWRETHHGRDYWVIRKGCTPARPGQEGFVGGSMGDDSVILEGVESAGRDRLAVLDRARRRPRDEPDAGGGPRAAAQALRVHGPRLRPRLRLDGVSSTRACRSRRLPRPPGRGPAEGLGRGADQAGRRRLAGGAGAAARAGHRARRRRRGRGAGGLQAPAGGARRARRLDPREAHAAPARRRDGRP